MKEEKTEFKIQLIEEGRYNPGNLQTEYRTTLLYKPNKESLEINLYEKRFVVTDTEKINRDSDITNLIRKSAAMNLFAKFYEDNFLNTDK